MDNDQDSTLVAISNNHENNLNNTPSCSTPIINEQINSSNIESILNNSIDKTYQENNLIKQKQINQLNGDLLDNHLINSNQNDNQFNQKQNENQFDQKQNDSNDPVEESTNEINKSNEDDTIDKLGLNLDYQPQTNLSELERSITSLNSLSSTQKSEINSIHSSNSRANSPSRSSQHNLPIKRVNTSETSLLVSEHDHSKDQSRYFEIERKNLMHLASLIINNLINNISPLTKTLECHDNVVLYDFFSITEQILKHGLRARKGLIFGKKELWNVFESLCENSQLNEIVQNIRELPNVKTNNGRVKALLRLAFVHKVFNETITHLIESKELLKNFYDDGAFIQSNEIDEFLNKTSNLKDFDFRWCAKDDQLDQLSNLIDLTNYLIDKERTTKEIIYKVNINKDQLKELIEEKQFYENKSKEFRNKILFYYNRIKELGIETLFEGELHKSPSKLELLTKKLNELFKSPVEKVIIEQQNPDIQSLQEDIVTLKKQLEIELSNRVAKDAALEFIESDVLVKQDENIVMRHQIEEVKQVNEDLCIKIGELGKLNSDLNQKITLMTSKNQQLVSNVTELQRHLVTNEAKYNQLSTIEKQLRKQFEEIEKLNQLLKAQVLEEQNEVKNLRKKLDDNIERNSTVVTELNAANNRANDYRDMKKKHDILLRRCAEYEITCEEIGVKLANAQLEIENLKEQTIPYSDATWKDEKLFDKCENCSVLFSTLIRKHHCRNCGGVFCNKCSDRKIPLPAKPTPCRVCDACYLKLMNRYNG